MRMLIALMVMCAISHVVPWCPASARAELSANQVLIVANANNRDSLMVAEHYATRRGVPFQQIAKLDLPSGETMSRADYDRRLVLPLRQALQKNRLQRSIRVLVTVYGVPLRVEPPILTAEEERVRRDATGRLDAARSQLENIERKARDLATQLESTPVLPKTVHERLTAYERHLMVLLSVDDTVQEFITRTKRLKPPDLDQWHSRVEAIIRPYQGSAGIAQLHYELHRGEQALNHDGEERIRAQYTEGMQLLLGSVELPIHNRRAELYQRVEELYGAYGVFGLAAMELKLLSVEYADASVDSELTLLWWDRNMYGVAGRQISSLYHGVKKPPRGSRREIPLLMVSRLDGPNRNVAMHLVDRSMEAEQQGLSGTIYLDARGLRQSNSDYGHYDQSLRDLDTFLTQHTTYRTILENTEARFHRPGEAPDVALYAGWYRLRHYEDAFTFRPGAIGYHMASAEAVSIHTASEYGWCKNALERGIAATLGSIGEPYLDAFPEPLEFVALLTTGQYSLVEAYYLTSRWISWRMVLFGDPLYAPWKNKPAAKRSTLTMFPLAPIAPSDQNFDDPLLARDELQRLREQSRIRLDTIFRISTPTLVR